MELDAKTIYAQSSDIKSRTYLEYRKDMKRKAIAELEITEWLQDKISNLYPKQSVKVHKSGGDKFLWFLRKGGVTREPDFIAEIKDRKIYIEFQYAGKSILEFYDFKESKIGKKKKGEFGPIENKRFIYIHKPLLKYAIFSPEWVLKNGQRGMVPAWRSYAYRVPKEKFEKILKGDKSLKNICEMMDIKNFILNFQHCLININKENLSYLLQSVVDKDEIVKIVPKDLDSFFKICFILDSIGKIPENANLWLLYLLSYINESATLKQISEIVYCIDFLYSKVELKRNELDSLIIKIKELMKKIKLFEQKDGSFKSSLEISPVNEIRYALFSINLLEDLIQDMIYYYSVKEFKSIRKIYENVNCIKGTYNLIKEYG